MTKQAEPIARLLPWLAATLAVLIACRRTIFGFIRYDDYKFTDISPYNVAVLTPNYIDNGLIRRGLGGTIMYLLDGGSAAHPAATAALYQLIGALMLAIPMALLLRKLARAGDSLWRWYAGFMLVSPQLFWGWSREPGRSDMLISGIIAWSVLAALRGRILFAALLLFAGSLIHETAIIYGGPLLVALWFVQWRQGIARPVQIVAALGVLATLVAATALAQLQFGDDVTGIAATVRGARLAASDARLFDVATYLTWGGFVSIDTSLCMALSDRAVPWMIAAGFVVFIINCFILFDRSWAIKLLLGFAALVPMVFMSLIAIDHGRWLMFAVANAWLAVVAARLLRVETAQPDRRRQRLAVALLALLVLMGPASAHYPSFALEKLAPRIFRDNNPKWLADCAPDWQRTLEPAAR